MVSNAFERLSSGLRINTAGDDIAGLAVAASLKTGARIFAQGIRNINDGIGALNIAESALSELSGVVTRIRELAEQSANGTYSLSQRRALDAEADALAEEFNRIIDVTSFNGIKLLDGSISSLSIQAGAGSDAVIQFSLGNNLTRSTGTGTFGALTTTVAGINPVALSVADYNNDGFIDLITANNDTNSLTLLVGNGDGTFSAPVSIAGGTSSADIKAYDFNNDGNIDFAAKTGISTGMIEWTLPVTHRHNRLSSFCTATAMVPSEQQRRLF